MKEPYLYIYIDPKRNLIKPYLSPAYQLLIIFWKFLVIFIVYWAPNPILIIKAPIRKYPDRSLIVALLNPKPSTARFGSAASMQPELCVPTVSPAVGGSWG